MAKRLPIWLAILLTPKAFANFTPQMEVDFFLDSRLVHGTNTLNWQARGPGKTRYGTHAKSMEAEIAEASVILRPHFTPSLSARVHALAQPNERDGIGVVDAFLNWRPASTSRWAPRFKLGMFFPPFSRENFGRAWTSPYSVTSSAMNSWIGEELRIIGGEASLNRRGIKSDLNLYISLYGFNDPLGSVLAWRGWALQDRKTTVRARLPIPNLPAIRPGGTFASNSNYVEPLWEIDQKIGGWTGFRYEHINGLSFGGFFYHNDGSEVDRSSGQYSWKTYFGVGDIQYKYHGLTLLTQAMVGNTRMGYMNKTSPVNNDFVTYYLLANYDFGVFNITGRYDNFRVRDRDTLPRDNNNENGHALLASLNIPVAKRQKVMIEYLHLDFDRPMWLVMGNPNRHFSESQLQVSYRLYL